MRFPIDVVYLSGENRVMKIVEAMPAWRVSACLRARSVLEMPAGRARETGLQAGHSLAFQEPTKPAAGA